MILTAPFIAACAPTVAPETIAHVVAVESSGNPLAINVNGLRGAANPIATTAADATRLVAQYLALGHSVDMGLMQVNTANLARLGYSVADMFDPCRNLAAGAAVLTGDYLTATRSRPDPQVALRAALSAYNTGNFTTGFRNGYVARYTHGPATITLPDVLPASTDVRVVAPVRPQDLSAPVVLTRRPPPPDSDPLTAPTEVNAEWKTP